MEILLGCCHRYIKTSGNATVDHLSKYLAVRLALEELRSKGESNQMNLDTASEKQYTIYIATAAGQFTVSTAPPVRPAATALLHSCSKHTAGLRGNSWHQLMEQHSRCFLGKTWLVEKEA